MSGFVPPAVDWREPVDLCALCSYLVSAYGVEIGPVDDRDVYVTHDPRLAAHVLPGDTAGMGAPGYFRLHSGPLAPQQHLPLYAVATVRGTRVCAPHIGLDVPELGSLAPSTYR